tara:strand:- start:3491 stop:4507 length:1017 start_codon:yes stop_codon:yes gene_type:complete
MLKQFARNVLPYDAYQALARAKHFVAGPYEHQQLMAKRRDGARYLSARIDTVTACNHRCQYCYTLDLTGHRTQLMSLEDFKKAAANLFPYCHTVALSCAWEPTMNKNLADFIRVAASFDVPFLHFVSNGSYLTEEIMEAMVDCGLDRMAVSIDAATPETYEKIREVNDLERVLENLGKLRDLKAARGSTKPLVNINWTAFEENADEAIILARDYNDLFDTFWFWHLLPRMRNTVNPFHRMEKDRFFDIVRQLREILGNRLVSNEFNNDRSNKPLGICNRSLDNIRVEPDGSVEVTCSKHRLAGNILSEDFSEIYAKNEPLFDELYKKNTDFCRNDCGR